MEELEENDDGWLEEDRSQSSRSHHIDSVYEIESTGESIPFNFKPPTSQLRRISLPPFSGMDSVNPKRIISSFPFWESRFPSRMVNVDMNQNKVGGIGESVMPKTNGNSFPSPVSANQRFERCEPEFNSGIAPANTPSFISSNFSCGERKANNDKQSTCKNQYLAILEVCDETSMVANDLIGLAGEALHKQ